jgi:hypothetical protein
MHISQNSSAFGGVRCVIARAVKIESCRSRREAFDGGVLLGAVKVRAVPGDAEEMFLASCPHNDVQV